MRKQKSTILVHYSPVTVPIMLVSAAFMGWMFIFMGTHGLSGWITVGGYGLWLVAAWFLLKLVIWRGGAVLLRDDRLVYELLRPRGDEVAGIKDISLSGYWAGASYTRAIQVIGHDGSHGWLPALWTLHGDADGIVADLRAACGLSQEPDAGTPRQA